MHTRGRRTHVPRRTELPGTTHAHAGQTRFLWLGVRATWNHPCTRGADQKGKKLSTKYLEPPMHTRGRLRCAVVVGPVHGTTHAHAGQTEHPPCKRRVTGNHPCTRGADRYCPYRLPRCLEPPMHTRGRPAVGEDSPTKEGTTHAHAGQTEC